MKKIIIVISIILIIVASGVVWIKFKSNYNIGQKSMNLEYSKTYNMKKDKLLDLKKKNKFTILDDSFCLMDDYFKDLPEECGTIFSISYFVKVSRKDTQDSFKGIIDIKFTEEQKKYLFMCKEGGVDDAFYFGGKDGVLVSNTYYGTTFGKTVDEIASIFSETDSKLSIQVNDNPKFDEVTIKSYQYCEEYCSQLDDGGTADMFYEELTELGDVDFVKKNSYTDTTKDSL